MPTSVAMAVLMCHAPIVVPSVAGARATRVAASTKAMKMAAQRLVDASPDALIVIAPYARKAPLAWLINNDDISGSLTPFGAFDVRVEAKGSEALASAVASFASERGLTCHARAFRTMEHSATVPLYFLAQAGWHGPTAVLAIPEHARLAEAATMGRVLADAARALNQRWAIVASGDLSHRLHRDAPAGYHARAHEFDESLIDLIRRGNFRGALSIPDELRALAAEDVLESLAVASGALDFEALGHEVLSYEAPFGVGYLVAWLGSQGSPQSDAATL